jgi:lipid-A-disaccharide synthase
MLVIFPFEKEYFHKRGVDAVYVGNPLVDIVKCEGPAASGKPYIALLPGSRRMEIDRTMPVFLELEKLLASSRLKDYRLVMAAAPSIDDSVYGGYLKDSSIELVRDGTWSVLGHAAAAAIDSGTASLEAALLDVPQVVVYAMNPLSYRLARMMLKTRYISLVNLILDKPVFSELIQKDFTAGRVLSELERLVFDEDCRNSMKEDYASLRERLGEKGAADRAAKEIITKFA